MKNCILKTVLLSASLSATTAFAQLSSNPDKFLGNITTRYNVDTDGIQYWTLWNQITPENESKWGSVEGSKGNFNWGGADKCYNYAKDHNFPFKFHAIIWGAQHPNWFNADLSVYDRQEAIKNWMKAMKEHYNKIDLIDVANECVSGHQPDTHLFVEPLGGAGATGWDWLIKAFKMAHEKWPEAILIYNDFNTFQWNTDQFIELVTKLRDGGAPIDAYGCQSHDLTDCSLSNFKNSMNKLQNALKMPMVISEYDLGTFDDAHQKTKISEQFPLMWEADYCAGVTMWGFIYGATWTTDGNSGLIKNGQDRPAMTWLREYMAKPEAAKTKSPYPGMKKPISLYIQPESYKAEINRPCPINIEAKTHNGTTVEKVEFFVNNTLVATLTEAPYIYEYTPLNENKVNLKAIAYTSDGKTYERLGGMYGTKWGHRPFHGEPIELPGVLEAEDFDMGGEGISYHTGRTSATSTYREDQGTVGIYSTTDGYCIDQPVEGDWYEYTVNMTSTGKKNLYAVVGTTESAGSEFTITIYKNGEIVKKTAAADRPYNVPKTGRKTFTTLDLGDSGIRWSKGEYKIRITLTKGKTAIDKLFIGVTPEATGIDEMPSLASAGKYRVYNTSGVYLGEVEDGYQSDITEGVRQLTGKTGIFVLKNASDGTSMKVAIR